MRVIRGAAWQLQVCSISIRGEFDLPDVIVALAFSLAAVIASFVLSFGDTVNENVQTGADISVSDSGNATATWISEENAANLSISTSPKLAAAGSTGVHASTTNLQNVGDSTTIYKNG